MPTVHDGIGTWYYGKDRIHTRKDTCKFCHSVEELRSYDTTLYFVLLFVPIFPLGRKRVLEECPRCQKHLAISLKEWEAVKARGIAQILEELQNDPDNRDTIMQSLALATAYQDEGLFDQLAGTLAADRREDAGIQAQLGAGYSYFVRWPEAEAAYQASLQAEDDFSVRLRLAWVLLKQFRPEEAHVHLRPVLEQPMPEHAGMIYLLIEAYQAQGMHHEALEVMDQRDRVFPDVAANKDCQKQRQTSERHLATGTRVRSRLLGESRRVGYREGSGWGSRIARLLGPLILLGLLVAYLGSAIWIGRSRKVFLVNGLDRPYTVAVNGHEHTLQPATATPIRVAEGEIAIEFQGDGLPGEAVRCTVTTPFFSRPFGNRTFVINPDQVALVAQQEAIYSAVPQGPGPEPRWHTNQVLHSFQGLDYEFEDFPASLNASKGQTIRKTRVALAPGGFIPPERLFRVTSVLPEKEQRDYIKRWLELNPDDPVFLASLHSKFEPSEAVKFLGAGLPLRPVRVEWHSTYQDLHDRVAPGQDRRPEYRKLVTDTGNHPDALYLLGRLQESDEATQSFQKAALGKPPSVLAINALGQDALGQGQFKEAVEWGEKAIKLAPDHPRVRRDYQSALLAAGQFDPLLEEVQKRPVRPESRQAILAEKMRILAAKGDLAGARDALEEAVQSSGLAGAQGLEQVVRDGLEMTLCCARNDLAGYLKLAQKPEGAPSFEAALLQDKLDEAAAQVGRAQPGEVVNRHALLYLAAHEAKNRKLAEEQWQALLSALGKSSHHHRRLGEMLAGKRPLDVDLVRKQPIDPAEKRVLLVVVARRHPDNTKNLLPLARSLNFHRDETSLCLRKVLK